MLNCTVTYRSRDKKPGDNILNDSALKMDENGNFTICSEALKTYAVTKENDINNLTEYVTMNKNTIDAINSTSIKPIAASLKELYHPGKHLPLSAGTRTETTD